MLGRVNSEPDFRCPSIVLAVYLNLSGLHTGYGGLLESTGRQ